MPQWHNPALTVFHGTDSVAAGGFSRPGAISLPRCKPATDFGQGFYTTTRLHQAKQWANQRVLRAPAGAPAPVAVVLQFDLDRDWLASLESLVFVRPTQDYWDLVTDCRHGFAPHQRRPPNAGAFDIVYGPVSLWPQTLVIADCDQISFHTPHAIAHLPVPTVRARANAQDSTKELF